jgi:hypothetical protein
MLCRGRAGSDEKDMRQNKEVEQMVIHLMIFRRFCLSTDIIRNEMPQQPFCHTVQRRLGMGAVICFDSGGDRPRRAATSDMARLLD